MASGEDTVRLSSGGLACGTIYRATAPVSGHGRHRQEWLARAGAAPALMVATFGAGVLWVGLEESSAAGLWPLYALVWAVLAAWVPYVGWMVESAYRADLTAARDAGYVAGYREGYPDGYVDCATLK